MQPRFDRGGPVGRRFRRFGGGFNPLALPGLLAGFEPGATEIYSDAAGSTAGGPPRLVLDQSSGLRRGFELWSDADATASAIWTESGGAWVKAATGNARLGLATLAADTWYEVQFTIAPTASFLNLWRVNVTNTGNEQAASNLGAGSHRVIVKSGPAADAEGHFLWFDKDAFTGTIENLSFREMPGNHFTAPSDDARPQYLTGGAPHLSADGANDTLRADVALNGTLTVWMAGDFSQLGGDRFLSFGGDLGADWNRAGYIAFEDDAGGYLKMVRDNVAAQITTGYPPYILLEIDAAGHRSYGPLGVNSALAAPATSAERIGLYAAANSTPSANGAMKNTSFGVVQGALDPATRSKVMSHLAGLGAPV